MRDEVSEDLFSGEYEVGYIENLLKIIRSDVQNNSPISDEDYLTIALRACEEYDSELGDSYFDERR